MGVSAACRKLHTRMCVGHLALCRIVFLAEEQGLQHFQHLDATSQPLDATSQPLDVSPGRKGQGQD